MEQSSISTSAPPQAQSTNFGPHDLQMRWLGPRVVISAKSRLIAAAVAIVCLAVLALAATLKPDPRGYGTHEQLGLSGFAPCGFMLSTGLPCPTCGMTTSFALMMHGRPYAAIIAQPAGALLCLATLVAAIVSGAIATTGRARSVNWNRIGPVRLALSLAFVFLGGWAFKIVHGLLAGTLPAR
jgi:hypothetical protein